MSLSSRILIAAAAMSLAGVAGSMVATTADAATAPIIDCFYIVNAVGNGHSTYLLSTTATGTTLTPNGTIFTGEQLDILQTATPRTDPDGNTLYPAYPRNKIWYPEGHGTTSYMDSNGCSIDSGNQ
jgi:hypothetical protein